jgi:hypothetical protein
MFFNANEAILANEAIFLCLFEGGGEAGGAEFRKKIALFP